MKFKFCSIAIELIGNTQRNVVFWNFHINDGSQTYLEQTRTDSNILDRSQTNSTRLKHTRQDSNVLDRTQTYLIGLKHTRQTQIDVNGIKPTRTESNGLEWNQTDSNLLEVSNLLHWTQRDSNGFERTQICLSFGRNY